MIELFRELLIGVAAAALCSGAAILFAKGKAMQEVLRLAAGLAVLLAVLQPLSQFRFPDIYGKKQQTHKAVQVHCDEMQRELANAAAQQVEAYVQARAEQLGVPCTAKLQFVQEAEKTLVTGVQLTCSRNIDAAALSQMLVSECGIPKELQIWNWTD